MPLIKGTDLSKKLKAEALQFHVHRMTGDHTPDWAKIAVSGRQCPLQFKDDADWLANTEFRVSNGELGRECVSTPTWPNNPELRDD